MLILYEWSEVDYDNNGIGILHEASGVNIQREINGDYRLEFSYPDNGYIVNEIKENRLVKCEGQLFRITHIADSSNNMKKVTALHIYRDNEKTHIQYIKNYMGKYPYDIITGTEMKTALSSKGFSVLTKAQVKALGMEWIDGKIDFWEQSKTTPADVINTIINNAGFGELYIDNRNIAIVKRIGSNNGIRINTTKNAQEISKEVDISNMITRLYPYGQNDLHIGSVNNGKQYIDSPNIDIYGVKEGFNDYNDITSASNLMSRAEWEFDNDNAERIDVPAINIEAKLVDLSKLAEFGELEKINLGDTVIVTDSSIGVDAVSERVTQITYYPYEPINTTVTIGRMKTDLWFYLKQMNSKANSYDKVSNTNGDVKTNHLIGNVNSDVNNILSENERFSIVGDLLVVKDDDGNIRQKIGFDGDNFVFEICSEDGETKTVYINDEGVAVFAGTISTAKNALVGGILEVGRVNEQPKIRFYGMDDLLLGTIEAYAENDGEETYINIKDVTWLQLGGNNVALKSDIEELERVISDINDKISNINSGGIAIGGITTTIT